MAYYKSEKVDQGRKGIYRAILEKRDFDALLTWMEQDRSPLRIATMLLFEDDALTAMRAVEALGKVCGLLAEENLEKVRRQIRKLLWLMNDESGGLCRRGPEAIAEILVNVPALIDDYAQMIPQYLWEEPFEAGSRRAMIRLMQIHPVSCRHFIVGKQELIRSLSHESPEIRGYSYIALNILKNCPNSEISMIPSIDEADIELYDFEKGVMGKIRIA